jgi:hypothetical protein
MTSGPSMPPASSNSSWARSGSNSQNSHASVRCCSGSDGAMSACAGVRAPAKIASMTAWRSMAIDRARRRTGSSKGSW